MLSLEAAKGKILWIRAVRRCQDQVIMKMIKTPLVRVEYLPVSEEKVVNLNQVITPDQEAMNRIKPQ
jgi:hypothetical protein